MFAEGVLLFRLTVLTGNAAYSLHCCSCLGLTSLIFRIQEVTQTRNDNGDCTGSVVQRFFAGLRSVPVQGFTSRDGFGLALRLEGPTLSPKRSPQTLNPEP